MVILAPFTSSAGFLLLYLRWRGHTSFAESLYILPAGFGMGVSMAALFVSLSAAIKKSDVAIASGGFYLSNSLGEVTGVSLQNAILQASIKQILVKKLEGAEERAEVSLLGGS